MGTWKKMRFIEKKILYIWNLMIYFDLEQDILILMGFNPYSSNDFPGIIRLNWIGIVGLCCATTNLIQDDRHKFVLFLFGIVAWQQEQLWWGGGAGCPKVW